MNDRTTTILAVFAAAEHDDAGTLSAKASAFVDELRAVHPAASCADLVVGAEIGLRIIEALDGHVEGGWSASTAALVVASAVVGSRTRELDPVTTERAIGLAATQAAGLAALEDSPLGMLQRAYAVRAGAEAATLAGAGIEGHRAALEGRRGLFALVAPTADPATVTDGLGERWLSLTSTERTPA